MVRILSKSLDRKRAPTTATSLHAGCPLPLPSNSIGFQVSHFCTTILCLSHHVNRMDKLPPSIHPGYLLTVAN
jgi:hypothetical protein